MKRIGLNKGQFALVDDVDFDWLNQWKWHIHSNGVRRMTRAVSGKRGSIFMHHMLLPRVKGLVTDHEDGDNFNNQRHNLRHATRLENRANSRVQSDNKSGLKGVNQTRNGRWRAYIYTGGKQINLGFFDTAVEAAKAYNNAALEQFGNFARLNEVRNA